MTSYIGSLKKIKGLLSQSCINGSYLQALIQEISACECIEYAMYYAGRANMKVTCQSPSNAKLKLLVMENTTEIVNALLWRAIKQMSKERGKREAVAFEEIVDLTFETYVRYKKSNIQIEGYKFPNQIRPFCNGWSIRIVSYQFEFLRIFNFF